MIGSVSSPANTLNQTENTLTTAQKRLVGGRRINSAQDDAAGLAIATQMAAQLGSGDQALRNIHDGLALTNTASGALGEAASTLQTMRQLAVQAANGTNSPSDRAAIQAQFGELAQSIDQLADQAAFNGRKLFTGEFTAQLQSGPEAGNTRTLTLGALSTQSLGIAGENVSSVSAAAAALGAIDQALSRIGAQQGAIGAAQAGISSAAVSLAGSYENLAAAKSRLSDADYAKETATEAQAKVQQQAALQVTSKLNANQASLLQLFQKV